MRSNTADMKLIFKALNLTFNFQRVNRLFVFENDAYRRSYKPYIFFDFRNNRLQVMTDGKYFFKQLVKKSFNNIKKTLKYCNWPTR